MFGDNKFFTFHASLFTFCRIFAYRNYKQIIIMKKILFLCLLMCGALESHALELNGKFVSQSGELLFRFTADSLYIDIAQSQRNPPISMPTRVIWTMAVPPTGRC